MKTSQTTDQAFVEAYLIAALWSSTGADDDPLDNDFGPSDLAPEARARAEADCAKFLAENRASIEAAIATGAVVSGPDFDEWGLAGHDFWLTRCGHGAGFWDGDWPEPMATQLTEAAHKFGNLDLYAGDNGRLYF